MVQQISEKDHIQKPRKGLGTLSKIFDNVLTVMAYLSGFIIVFMMLSISYEVVMRYFFTAPTIWVVDFSGYMQLALVFLGAAWVLKNGGHAKIDIVLNRFKGKQRTILYIVISFIGLVACAIFFWKGLEATWAAHQRGDFLYRDVEIPKALLLAFFPLGLFLLCIQFAREIYNHWRAL